MKQFVIKGVLFFAMSFGTIFGVIYLTPVGQDKYLATLIDKHHTLSTTPDPRMIFAGDSNIAYGLDSEKVEQATGYRVVNMGLHGGLGVRFNLDELKHHLRSGDIVVLLLDYSHFVGDGAGTNTIVEATIFLPGLLRSFSPRTFRSYASNIPTTFQRRMSGIVNMVKGLFQPQKPDDPSHRRSYFNKYGDQIGHIAMEKTGMPAFKKAELYDRILPSQINPALVKLMNDFYDHYTAKGVKIFLMIPAVMEGRDAAQQERFTRSLTSLEIDLRKNLKMPVIGESMKFVYPQSYFFDNEFHLNGTGRQVRTKLLIEYFKKDPVLGSAPTRK